jgi:hypothetical protein
VPYIANFQIKNTSSRPLILTEVLSGCHCAVTDYDHTPIPAGATSQIKVTYDAHRQGVFYKIVNIKTNFDPDNYVTIALQGVVR